jgi:acyl-[acyl-carrier-protein]-phospholipid O-acyltransferase/long-chain-fatty-acid--[acyl-carrier-protein] ligase
MGPLGWLLVACALFELILVYRLPTLEPGDSRQQFDWPAYRRGRLLLDNIARLKGRTVIRLSIVGLATFWSIGQVMQVAFQTYVESEFLIDEVDVIQLTLAFTAIGIMIGAALAARASRDHIETGLIPLGAVGVAICLWLLPGADTLLMQRLCFLVMGIAGALFIVPLNALIQFGAGAGELGRILAASNWFQNLAMLAALMLTALLAAVGVSSTMLLYLLAVVATAGCAYTVYQLPQSLVRYALAFLFQQRYRVCVQGMKNIPETGGVLLLGNHVSWVDWAFVQIACPRRVRFVMARHYYDKPVLRWLLQLMGCIPILPGASSRNTLETITRVLDAGHVVCLFPEGTITRTGHLLEFKRGYETAAGDAGDQVVIVPFFLQGLWGSQFSRSGKGLRQRRSTAIKREIRVAFGEALPRNTPADVLKRRIFDLSMTAWQGFADGLPTLPAAWIDTAKRMRGRIAILDPVSGPLSGLKALTGAVLLARRVRALSPEPAVGLLLPASAAGALSNMAALLAGKCVVNLNYTASDDALRFAIAHAEVKTVYTSRRFVERLQKRGRDLAPLLEDRQVVYAEDLRAGIGKAERTLTWLMIAALPAFVLRRLVCRAHDPARTAVILFSSGSEGMPKGVMLSHRNIMANANQVADALNVQDGDMTLSSLPLFHAFGLNAMTLMPLVIGIPFACYPDPTDAMGIARTVAEHRATIMCSTTSFLRLFVRNSRIEPELLQSLRLVVAGAEPLNPEVRDAFQSRFQTPVFEGYGCTETAPVAGANLPDAIDPARQKPQIGNRPGSIGMPLHGTSFRIVDPESFEELVTGEEGMILIGGPQVMQGYLKDPERTASAVRAMDGSRWFVTGDKGSLDADGFLTIRDRYSRFAKIAGEMVSLGEVEGAIRASLPDPDIEIVAVSVPDARKGEAVVVLHEGELDTRAIAKAMLDNGIPGLMAPARWIAVDVVPKLGSGKTDYVAAKALARADQ